MVNGSAPSDLSGPLGSMWRSVYRKAAQVAEGRTEQLLREHAYVLHRDTTGGEDTGPFVDEAGDTMSGTLSFEGEGVATGGAVVVRSGLGADAHGYGAASATFAPTGQNLFTSEGGLRFTVEDAAQLVAVRWYRLTTGQTPPTAVRLWQATAPTTPLLTLTSLPEFADTAVGWKERLLSSAEKRLLVTGRDYVVSYPVVSFQVTTRHDGYAPVGDLPLVFGANVRTETTGTIPAEAAAGAYGIDPVVRVTASATVGAIRLPNGDAGVIAWRNDEDTADDTLTVDAADQLLYNGSPIGGAGGVGSGNTTMHTQTGTPTGAPNSLWFNPSEAA